MASNVSDIMENELLNSGSEEEDSENLSNANVATRTSNREKKMKKSRAPRPIEANVRVENDQNRAGRSGEVSEDRDLGIGDVWSANKYEGSSSTYVSERKKTESFGGSSVGFDSEEDISGFKKEALFWLRHPRIRENWKTVAAAFLLFFAGIAFLLTGIVLAATGQDGMKSVIFFVCAGICILPGGYHIIYIYRATKGQRGYNFESIPSFQ